MASRVDIPLDELIRLVEQLDGFPVKLGGKLVGRITNPAIVLCVVRG